jgi:hypothetical protein
MYCGGWGSVEIVSASELELELELGWSVACIILY